MKRSRFTDSQILTILKQNEAGTPVSKLCPEHGMSDATIYKWRAKYGGMDASLIRRMKELEDENCRLKRIYAEESSNPRSGRMGLRESGKAISTKKDGAAFG